MTIKDKLIKRRDELQKELYEIEDTINLLETHPNVLKHVERTIDKQKVSKPQVVNKDKDFLFHTQVLTNNQK